VKLEEQISGVFNRQPFFAQVESRNLPAAVLMNLLRTKVCPIDNIGLSRPTDQFFADHAAALEAHVNVTAPLIEDDAGLQFPIPPFLLGHADGILQTIRLLNAVSPQQQDRPFVAESRRGRHGD
jgi:hypothetical protein